MSRFLFQAVTDIRHGRESWRVFALLCGSSLVVAFTAGLLQQLG